MGRVGYLNWRRSVFLRDDFTCVLCSTRGQRLEAHHIKPWKTFPTLRYELGNGVTLCRSCHRQVTGKEEEYEEIMFTFLKKVGASLGRRLKNFLVNEDRAGASITLGTPEDETISGWSGQNEATNPVADVLAKSLDAVHFAGDPHHAEDAAKEDAAIVAAREQYDATKKQVGK